MWTKICFKILCCPDFELDNLYVLYAKIDNISLYLNIILKLI